MADGSPGRRPPKGRVAPSDPAELREEGFRLFSGLAPPLAPISVPGPSRFAMLQHMARSNGTRNSVAYADKSGTGWRNCRGNRPKMPHTDVGVVSHRRHPRQSALGLAEGHNALFYLESQPAPLRLCYKNGPFVSSGRLGVSDAVRLGVLDAASRGIGCRSSELPFHLNAIQPLNSYTLSLRESLS
jgi:hypothetical protein